MYQHPIKVYDRIGDCYKTLRIKKLLTIADSPERRSSNFINLGNGTYSARWGYGANVCELLKKLPSCQSCLKN